MAFFKNVFGRAGKKEKREFPNITMNVDPEEHWELVGELGDGAFGKVYKAKHRENGRIAAAKIVELNSDEDLDDFAVEIDILVECAESQYVIKLHESYLFKNKLWMLIEFCAGGAMDDVLQELNHGLNEGQMKVVTRHMFEALAFMHDKHIIHRDLKAGNLLLCSDGMVKLADFGVSALNKNAKQKRDSFIGTPFWMAPEVIACETNKDIPYDYKADIWSAGITMIELADVNPPNYEMHPMRVLFKIPKADPPTVLAPRKWSKHFNDFVAKCLVKEPDDRPTALEMLEHPFLQGVDSTQETKVLFAEIRADFEDIIQELDEQTTESATNDSMDVPDTKQSSPSQGSPSSTGCSFNPPECSRSNSCASLKTTSKEDDKPSNFKTLKRVRTYKVDGKEYSSTMEVIIDVNKGKSVEQQGERLLQAQRKLEVRERKILQREEVKETQTLFTIIQRDKEEQERRFESTRQELEKKYDNQLEGLARAQKKEMEKFEKKQKDDYLVQAKQIKATQTEDLKKFKKDSKTQEKAEEKSMASTLEAQYKNKSERKTAQKRWKTEYVESMNEKEKQFEQEQQTAFEQNCDSLKQSSRDACRDLEADLLAKRHELIQRREMDYWDNEQRHFDEHYHLSNTQLREAFRLQGHQMTERHKKEVAQHNRRTAIKVDIVNRRHAIENKTVPQNLKKQKATALANIRKQLKKKSVSRHEEKETLKKCESDLVKKQNEELDKLHQKQSEELEEVNTNGETALTELYGLQELKIQELKEREDQKLTEHSTTYKSQLEEYDTRLAKRKTELESEFALQREQLLAFYKDPQNNRSPTPRRRIINGT
ncbi:serine/threonine-protein kinase 10-like [Sycon ciliatum]|uniref:serine/threonine-protein kinase 10-like n=1 Tax=Sycon ciliatum TaxID=27933 RepID=UPI0020A8BD19|eukprot:scpid27209/ scgid8078/ Serine/threonine-protein kinase 10